jgi:hypothetical protein
MFHEGRTGSLYLGFIWVKTHGSARTAGVVELSLDGARETSASGGFPGLADPSAMN